VTPIAAIILFITILGIPLALVVVFSYLALIFFSCIFVTIFFGALLWKYFKKTDTVVLNWQTALIGALGVAVVSIIPILGGIIVFIALLIVLGTLVKMKAQYLRGIRTDAAPVSHVEL
jgi:hypothetical protein